MGEFTGFVVVVIAILTLIVHVCLAIGVFNDAQQRQQDLEQKTPETGRLYFVTPLVWALAVLLTGLIGTAIYWAMHYSTLERRDENKANPTP